MHPADRRDPQVVRGAARRVGDRRSTAAPAARRGSARSRAASCSRSRRRRDGRGPRRWSPRAPPRPPGASPRRPARGGPGSCPGSRARRTPDPASPNRRAIPVAARACASISSGSSVASASASSTHPRLRALPRLVGEAAGPRQPAAGGGRVPVHGGVQEAQLPAGDQGRQPRLAPRPVAGEGPLVEPDGGVEVPGPLLGAGEAVAGLGRVLPLAAPRRTAAAPQPSRPARAPPAPRRSRPSGRRPGRRLPRPKHPTAPGRRTAAGRAGIGRAIGCTHP